MKIEKVPLKLLFNEANGKAEQEATLAEHSRLEEEFAKHRLIVSAKVQEAAKALREAINAADAYDINIQEDLYDEASTLEEAISDAGWNTSSFC